MSCDPNYDMLFTSVKLGSVTAQNCFYDLSHYNGIGHASDTGLAEALADRTGEIREIGDAFCPRITEEAALDGLRMGREV